ncbi:hypothetical protein CR513_18851, partial [Mucuna pruriens]
MICRHLQLPHCIHVSYRSIQSCQGKLESDAKYYVLDDPYLWRLCSDQVTRRFGVPKALISDQGSHF